MTLATTLRPKQVEETDGSAHVARGSFAALVPLFWNQEVATTTPTTKKRLKSLRSAARIVWVSKKIKIKCGTKVINGENVTNWAEDTARRRAWEPGRGVGCHQVGRQGSEDQGGNLDRVHGGRANQSQRSQSGRWNIQQPWSWSSWRVERGWRTEAVKQGEGSCAAWTGEGAVGLRRHRVRAGDGQVRGDLRSDPRRNPYAQRFPSAVSSSCRHLARSFLCRFSCQRFCAKEVRRLLSVRGGGHLEWRAKGGQHSEKEQVWLSATWSSPGQSVWLC